MMDGKKWLALREAWKGYKTAKIQEDNPKMIEYANRIRKLEYELNVPTAEFPNLGITGEMTEEQYKKLKRL